jgi:hypothetical protein
VCGRLGFLIFCTVTSLTATTFALLLVIYEYTTVSWTCGLLATSRYPGDVVTVSWTCGLLAHLCIINLLEACTVPGRCGSWALCLSQQPQTKVYTIQYFVIGQANGTLRYFGPTYSLRPAMKVQPPPPPCKLSQPSILSPRIFCVPVPCTNQTTTSSLICRRRAATQAQHSGCK